MQRCTLELIGLQITFRKYPNALYYHFENTLIKPLYGCYMFQNSKQPSFTKLNTRIII